jgi:TPR repeat protein
VSSLAVVFLLLVAVVSSYSQSKTEKKELAALTQKATDGDASAQLELGFRYLTGRGVAIEDAVQARNWFTKAADHGNATAQFQLGEMFSSGWGIPEDRARAAIWYRKAAEQGLAAAQYGLGSMYEAGRGAPLDHKEAVRWIQKAADQNFAPAKAWMQAHGANLESVTANSADKVQPNQEHVVQPGSVASQESSAAVDIRYFPGDSRAVTNAEIRAIRNSLRWEPESVVLKPGGTARSNLRDGNGQKMGSVLVRWDKSTAANADKNSTHADGWRGQFSIQIENGTSCHFASSAQLEDDQGFIVVNGETWNSWMTHQPEGGQTSQARGEAVLPQNFSSLVLKPLTPYSTLNMCTTPRN